MDRQKRGDRVLTLYLRLVSGETVNKRNYTLEEQVTPRTFDRDIQTIRDCLSERFSGEDIIYDSTQKGYRLNSARPKSMTFSEGYILLKNLMHDSGLRDDETAGLADALLATLNRTDRQRLEAVAREDIANCPSASHGQAIMKMIQDLLLMIRQSRWIRLTYQMEEGAREFEVLPLNVERGTEDFLLHAQMETGQKIPGVLFIVSHIHSFVPSKVQCNEEDVFREQIRQMQAFIWNQQESDYHIEEMEAQWQRPNFP